jgi:hypothetical protein
MQDKIIGIVVFLVVGVAITTVGGEGGFSGDWMGNLTAALGSQAIWATAITALAVASLAMGVYTNGGLSGADVKGTILLLIVAAMVGGTFPVDSGGAWLGTAWLVTGGLRT